MLFSVLKEHRFAPYNDLPQFLTIHDLRRVDCSDWEQDDKNKDMICKAWNQRSFTDVTQVTQQIANEFKLEYSGCYNP